MRAIVWGRILTRSVPEVPSLFEEHNTTLNRKPCRSRNRFTTQHSQTMGKAWELDRLIQVLADRSLDAPTYHIRKELCPIELFGSQETLYRPQYVRVLV